MNRKIVIVSTYPEYGSKNIGDMLITNKLKELISEFGDFDITVVWRAAPWDSVKKVILSADHVFFACLAIRPFMHKNEYPYLEKVIDNEINFSVISAGTALPINTPNRISDSLGKFTVELLRRVNNKATVKTTRGALSQEACRLFGLDQFEFSGDIAFYNPLYSDMKFEEGKSIRKIVISDPHQSGMYLNSFKTLYFGLLELFPESEIVVAQHGVNEDIDSLCKSEGIESIKIYESPDGGLDVYNDADLHVGFRVHAHVSALSRRIYSYLLEQDGRGCDYGLTINQKISIPNYPILVPSLGIKSVVKKLVKGEFIYSSYVPVSPAEQLIALIRADREFSFRKFIGLEEQIELFNLVIRRSVQQSLIGIKQ